MFNKLSKTIFLLLAIILVINKSVCAKLTINEIYPAPPTGQSEWTELYNDGNQPVDLSIYTLYDLANNQIKITSASLAPGSFISVPSSNILNNGGDTVNLKTTGGDIIETVVYSGSFTADKTYTKCPDGNGSWFILSQPTKDESNNIACTILTPTVTPTVLPTPTSVPTPTDLPIQPTLTNTPIQPTPTILPTQPIQLTLTNTPTPTINLSIAPTYPPVYSNVYISEVMVNPLPSQNEWLEIYNDNDFSVSLNNWHIDDEENAGSTPRKFSLNIAGKNYQSYDLSSSIFNNSGDKVRLLDENKNLKDDFEYSSSSQGQTWGRSSLNSGDFCLQDASKNQANNPCLNPTAEPTAKSSTNQTLTLVKKQSVGAQPTKITSQKQLNSVQPYTNSTNFTNSTNKPAVLGQSTVSTDQTEPSPVTAGSKKFINFLLSLSFSYSLLSGVSVIFKIRYNI